MRATLLADGSSDAALLPVLRWALEGAGVADVTVLHADLRVLPQRPDSLRERIELALKLKPTDLLFVHRDAERESLAKRTEEVDAALLQAGVKGVPVVPVRMTEAWLLIDEPALRKASGNPAGTSPLDWPALKRLEKLPNPKETLYSLLVEASGLSGRRRASFRANVAVHQLAGFITDFSPLAQLGAFCQFQARLRQAVRAPPRARPVDAR